MYPKSVEMELYVSPLSTAYGNVKRTKREDEKANEEKRVEKQEKPKRREAKRKMVLFFFFTGFLVFSLL